MFLTSFNYMHYRCKTFRRAVDSPEVYRQLDDDSLYPLFSTKLHKNDVLSKMRENRNPNMLFRDGMVMFILHFIEVFTCTLSHTNLLFLNVLIRTSSSHLVMRLLERR